jgi:hypothetical protein
MRLASLCVLVTQAAALSAPRPRVAVVGPAGDTVADAVAVRLNDADVTRCINENAGYVDAAVVCADGGEEKLSALAERCAGARAIVLVAPAGAADEDEGFSLPNPLKLLDGAAETNDVDEVAERCRNGGARVAVVRHGPLFGAGARDADVVAFSQGLRRAPTLVDDFGRRGARVVSVQQNEEKQDQFLSTGTWLGLGDMDAARSDVQAREGKAEPQTPARRGAVADAAAATIRRFQDLPGTVEFEVRSGSGSTSPSPEEWDAMVLSVCRERSSPEAMAKQLLSTKIWDPAQLGDWLRTEWGPKALMSVDATLAIRGARPVAFEAPSVQAEASGQLGALRWETLEDDGIKIAGRLTFTLSDNVLRATRDGGRELSGEAELVDNLIDAVDDFGRSRCADVVEKAMEAAVPEVFAAQEAAIAEEPVVAAPAPAAAAPVAAAPAEVTPAAPKKRRRAVAKKTGAAPSAAAPAPAAPPAAAPAPVPAPAPAAAAPPAVEAAPAEVKEAVDAAAAAAKAQAAAKAPAPPAGAAKKKKRRSAVKSRTKKKGGASP